MRISIACVVTAMLVAGAGVASAQDVLPEPQLIAYGQGGVQVGDTSVYGSPVDSAAFDPAQDLIWFQAVGELHVIDLRAADRTPILIATNLPAIFPWAVTGVSTASFRSAESGVRYPVLTVGKSPKIAASKGKARFATKAEDKAAKKAIKKIKLVGKKWLKKQKKRKAHKTVARPGKALERVELPRELSSCAYPAKHCGKAYSVTAQYEVVIINDQCMGEGECPASCVLHDRSTGLFADPNPDGDASWGNYDGADLKSGECWGYSLHPDGKQYAVEGFACSADGQGVSCTYTNDGGYLGWYTPA